MDMHQFTEQTSLVSQDSQLLHFCFSSYLDHKSACSVWPLTSESWSGRPSSPEASSSSDDSVKGTQKNKIHQLMLQKCFHYINGGTSPPSWETSEGEKERTKPLMLSLVYTFHARDGTYLHFNTMAGPFGYDNNTDCVVQEGGMSIWFAEAICPIRSTSRHLLQTLTGKPQISLNIVLCIITWSSLIQLYDAEQKNEANVKKRVKMCDLGAWCNALANQTA